MAMGSFSRKRQYKQEPGIEGQITGLARLLGMQKDSFQDVGNAVESQGQNVGRQKVAELMGTDAFKTATPVEQQSMVQATTGGRRLGESGQQTLDNAFKMSGDVQSNKWKQDAATLLNSRQVARDATNNAASMNRINAKNKLTDSSGLTGNMTEKLLKIKTQSDRIQKDLDNPNLGEEHKAARRAEQEALQITAEQVVSGGKPSAGGEENTMKNLFPGVKSIVKTSTTKPIYPKALSRSVEGLTRDEGLILKEKFDENEFKVIKGDEIPDKDGKPSGKYHPDTYFDAQGNPTNVNEIIHGKPEVAVKKTRADLTPEQQIAYDKKVLEKSNTKNAKRFGR